MAQLPLNEAISRIKQNDERFNKFLNTGQGYIAEDGTEVEGVIGFLNRIESEVSGGAVAVNDGVGEIADNDYTGLGVVAFNFYHVQGDAGGGKFFVDYDDTTSEDDLGSIRVDAAGNRLKRINENGLVTTAMFGGTELAERPLGDDNKILQNAFDYAKLIKAHVVIISPSFNDEYVVIEAERLDYQVHNSRLIFMAEIRMADNEPMHVGALITFSCHNTTVHNLRINGNRQNNIVSGSRGTQFNFAAYQLSKNLTFIGGMSRNALLCDMQSTSEGLTVDGMEFDTCGEHHLYLTLPTGQPLESVDVKNCKFKNWGLEINAQAISVRDYRKISIDNSEFMPGAQSYACIQGFTAYDSVVAPNESIVADVTRCKFRVGALPVYGWFEDDDAQATITASDCYFEGMTGSRPGAKNNFKIVDSTVDTTKYSSQYARSKLPDNAENVTFLVGLPAFLEDEDRNKVLKNCKFINKGTEPTEGNLIKITETAGNVKLQGCEFTGFNQFGGLGIIRDLSSKSTCLSDLRFVDCEGRAVVSGNPNLVIVNCHDVTGSTTGLNLSTEAALATGNYFPGADFITPNAFTPFQEDASREAGGVANSIKRIMYPKKGVLYTEEETTTGAIKITLPHNNTAMLKLRVEVYDHSSGLSFTAVITGQPLEATAPEEWGATSAVILAQRESPNHTVKFGADAAGDKCIWIGDTTTTWSRLAINIVEVQVHLSFATPFEYQYGWGLEVTQTEGTYGRIETATMPVADYTKLVNAPSVTAQTFESADGKIISVNEMGSITDIQTPA